MEIKIDGNDRMSSILQVLTEQLSQITEAKWNTNQIKNFQYQGTFLVMIYVEETSYFDVAPPGHTIAYKNIDYLLKNDKLMS